MLISNAAIVERHDYCELSVDAQCDTHWVWGDQPFRLWYRFPLECRAHLSESNGNPFLAAFLAPAMRLGESLEIEAPVSAKLYDSLPVLQDIYRSWDHRLTLVPVRAALRPAEPTLQSAQTSGLFFSLGIDSTYSLLKNIQHYPHGEGAVSHLINVLGFDIYLWESESHQELRKRIGEIATQLGKTTLPVVTNLRELSDRIVDWPRIYHGAALSSIGLALEGFLDRILIAASATYSTLIPWGSHPLLDPLWSSERVAFVHDGCEAGRFEKIKCLAASPWTMNTLRVCNADVSSGYNCGQCAKCIKAQVGLYIAGALQQCTTLPHEIDCERLRELELATPNQVAYFGELLAELDVRPENQELKLALEHCLAQRTA